MGGKGTGWALAGAPTPLRPVAGPSSPPQGHTWSLVSSRCYILENDTVQCDLDLYKSLQAWKDHKLHIDHEVTGLGREQCLTALHLAGPLATLGVK